MRGTASKKKKKKKASVPQRETVNKWEGNLLNKRKYLLDVYLIRSWLSKIYKELIQLFPGGSAVKNLPDNPGDMGDVSLIPGSGRSTGEENGNPFQYPQTEEPGGLQSIGSQKSQTWLSNWTTTCNSLARKWIKNRSPILKKEQMIWIVIFPKKDI